MIAVTRNTIYLLKDMGDGSYQISGHLKYCPTPTVVRLMWPPAVGKTLMWPAPTPDRPDRFVITTRVTKIHP